MNKVFKTVWNASLGVWVAVSETASSQKKGSNKLKKAAANAVATVAIGAATIGGVHAAGWSNGQGGTPGTGSIAIGTSEAAADASAEQSTAVGSGAQAGGGSVALGFGADASAGQDSLALGLSATASSGSTIAIGANSAASGSSSLAIGTEATSIGANGTAVGTQSSASAEGATAIGKSAQAAGKNAIAIGNGTNSGYEESIAIGTKAVVSKLGAVVIGTGTASGQYATVIGGASSVSLAGAASGDSSVVIGTGKAKGKSSVVVGNGEASGQNATVIGGGTASGQDSTVIGGGDASAISAQVFGGGIAIGERAKVFGAGTASGSGAQVFGAGEAKGLNAYVFGGGKAEGDETSVFGSGIATGLNALVVGGGTAAAANSMVMGTSTVSAANAVAIGANSNIGNAGSNSIVLGNNVSLNKANSVVLGENSILRTINLNVKDATINLADIKDKNGVVLVDANRTYQMTFAGTATNENVGAVSVGSQGKERQIQYVGAGRINSSSTDAVNGSQLYAILSQVASLEATPITFDDGKGGQATVKLGDTFNIEGATVNMVNGKPVLKVDAAEAASWKLATGGDVAGASTIGGETNVVDFVGGKNAEVSQTVLTDATGKPIGTQLTVEVADQIELTENGGLTIAGVPQGNGPITINQGNVNFGGNVISGVAPGVAGTDAVNVNQLKGSGWTIAGTDAAGNDVAGNVAKNNQVEFTAGPSKNVSVNTVTEEVPLLDENGNPVLDANGQPIMTHNAKVEVELANNIQLDDKGSIEFGVKDADGNITAPTTTLNAEGLTLAADQGKGPIEIKQDAITFGNNQLHDVAAGTELTDAVNVSQLKGAVDTLGGGAGINQDGSITGPTYIVGNAGDSFTTVGDAINKLNEGFKLTSSNATGAVDETIQAGDKIDITVTKENNNLVAKQDGSTIEFALANQIALTGDTAGLTIGAGTNGGQPIVIQQGNVNLGGNKLENIAAGTAPTDAVNVSQLQSSGWNIITQDKDAAGNVTGTTENAVNGDKDANTNSVQFNGDKNISVSQTSKEVVDAYGKVIGSETVVAVELEKDVDLSADGSLTIGNTLLNNLGFNLAGTTVGSKAYSPIIINQGNVNFGGNVIGGVANGVDPNDAVNVSQLKDEIGTAVSNSGWTLTTGGVAADQGEKIKPNTTVDFSGDNNITVSNKENNVTVALNPNLNLGDTGSVTIGDTLLNGNGLTVGDITIQEGDVDFGDNQLNNVADATEDHQAVNLGQLKEKLGDLTTEVNNTIANSGWNLTGQDADGNAVTEKVNPDETVEFVAGPSGNTTVTTETTANGAKVTVDLADQINLTGNAGSLTIGAGKGNNAITIEQGNINVGGNQINNLAAGTDGKDAVNVDQLKGSVNIFGGGAAVNPDGSIQAPTYNVNGGSYDNVGDALGALNQADIDLGDRVTNLQQSFNNRIDDVEDRMSAGIAAAMALETAPYVPGKYTYAAATAYHNGQAALGITLRKTADNGRWSLTGGVAAGTEGDPSVRLGVSGIID